MQLVQQQTANIRAIQGLYSRHLCKRVTNNAIKKLSAVQVSEHFADTNVALATQSLAVMQCLMQHVAAIEKQLKQQHQLSPEFSRQISIDGIGIILPLTIMLATGDISRFKKSATFPLIAVVLVVLDTATGKVKPTTRTVTNF